MVTDTIVSTTRIQCTIKHMKYCNIRFTIKQETFFLKMCKRSNFHMYDPHTSLSGLMCGTSAHSLGLAFFLNTYRTIPALFNSYRAWIKAERAVPAHYQWERDSTVEYNTEIQSLNSCMAY